MTAHECEAVTPHGFDSGWHCGDKEHVELATGSCAGKACVWPAFVWKLLYEECLKGSRECYYPIVALPVLLCGPVSPVEGLWAKDSRRQYRT